LRLTGRQWAIVALGAGLALPFGFRAPFASTGTLPVDVLFWPFLVAGLVLTGNREWSGLRRGRAARLLLGYVAVSAISLPIGIAAFHNTTGLRSYLYGVAIVANFAVGYLILRSIEDVKLLLRAFVVSLGLISIGISGYLLERGVLVDSHEIHNSKFITTLVYGWPNAFSVVVAVALVLAFYFLTHAVTRFARAAYAVLAASLAVCLVLTFSKTGWVCAVIAAWLLLLRFWSWRRQLALVGAVVAGAIALYWFGNESLRTQLFTVETMTERFTIVVDVFRYVNPLYIVVGSGSQALELLVAGHADVTIAPTVSLATLSPHDEFMNVLVKGGIVSLVLFVAALAVVMVRAYRLNSVDPIFRYWHAAAWAIMASLFTGEELRYWPLAALFWLVAGASAHPLARARTGATNGSVVEAAEAIRAPVASKPVG
jgi:hypothetical protein